MLHNSLLIRDKLREVNNNSMHRKRRNPHKNVRKKSGISPKRGEMMLDGSWNISSTIKNEGIDAVIKDFRDFLNIMEVELDDYSSKKVMLNLNPNKTTDAGYTLFVSENEVKISAASIEFIWAGIVYLERQMMEQTSPILEKGEFSHAPSWDVQISQAPYGANYLVPDLSADFLSDDAFKLLVHYGINGMTIYGDWLFYFNSKKYPELNHPDYKENIEKLKDAVKRAGKYGVKLYYVPVSPKLIHDHPLFQRLPSTRGAKIKKGTSKSSKKIHNLCSSDPESLNIHAEVMANLFYQVPDLGGLNLIIGGESYYHCFMRPDKTGLNQNQQTNCKSCDNHDPESTVSNFLQVTVDAVHAVAPKAWVTAWPYSAFTWTSDQDQMELVRQLPQNITFLNTIDKDQLLRKENHVKKIWDYSVDYTGPADNLLKQAEVIKSRDMDLFIKTETALGLEGIQYPYFPCLQRLKEKWENVKQFNPKGVLQSWMFFGMWGSRAEELGWWTSWHPEISSDRVIERISKRDFGENANRVVKAWEKLSEAVSHIPFIGNYFQGPEFIGPAHPLLFGFKNEDIKEFEAVHFYLQESEETFSNAISNVRVPLVYTEIPRSFIEGHAIPDSDYDEIDIIIKEYERVVSLSKDGFYILRNVKPINDDKLSAIFNEEKNLYELVYRTFLTTFNTYRFLNLKEKNRQNKNKKYIQEMVKISKVEMENAKESRNIYKENPWLDLSLRVDGEFPSSIAMIDRKISVMEQQLKEIERENFQL